MIVVMRRGATKKQVDAVLARIAEAGQPTHAFHGEERVVIAVLGASPPEELAAVLVGLPGVKEVGRTTRPYKLASRDVHPEDSRVRLGDVVFGEKLVLGAGVSRLHSAGELVKLARQAEARGAKLFWIGRPEGAELGLTLPLVAELRRSTRLPLLVEVWGPDEIDPVGLYCDGFLIGSLHLQSYPLVRAASRLRRPVVLARGASTNVEEWLLVAEQVLKGGNFDVVLCEQGIRTFESTVQTTLDFSAIAVIKRLSHLPIIANPSLAAGRGDLVPALALGAAGAGAHGVLIDVHLGSSDEMIAGAQSLSLEEFGRLAERLGTLSAALASIA
jgi:3-deoxy-7-phosphoheptulonate synthase